jgi:DNA repair protein RecO (recombination protein O)
VRKKKASITPAMLQPLTLVEIEVYHKENSGLQRLKELRVYPLLEQLQAQPLHQLSSALVAECFGRAIREESANEALFFWMQRQIAALDASDAPGLESLALLTRLTGWLGFMPQPEQYSPEAWLNLSEGVFESRRDAASVYAQPQTAQQMGHFLRTDAFPTEAPPGQRYFDDLLRLYQLHSPGFGLPRSLDLFRELVLQQL